MLAAQGEETGEEIAESAEPDCRAAKMQPVGRDSECTFGLASGMTSNWYGQQHCYANERPDCQTPSLINQVVVVNDSDESSEQHHAGKPGCTECCVGEETPVDRQ